MAVQAGVREARQAADQAMATLLMEQDQRAAAESQLVACQDNNAGLQEQLRHAVQAYGGAVPARDTLLVCSHTAMPSCYGWFANTTAARSCLWCTVHAPLHKCCRWLKMPWTYRSVPYL